MGTAIAVYKQRLKLHEAIFSRIDHDDAMVAIVYKVTLPTGDCWILKICPRPNDYHREVYFLRYLADKLPVPRLINAVAPEPGVDGAVLMQCVPGVLLAESDMPETSAFDSGALLARIHLNRFSGYGDLIQPDCLCADPCFPFTEKFNEGMAECSQHLPAALLEQISRYYKAQVELLRAVDGPCLVHRDFRPGNIMYYQGSVQAVIDWSSARAGFAQEDFCALEHSEWTAPQGYKRVFLAGYASVRPVPNNEALMPLLRLSKAIATVGFTVKRNTWNSKHMRIYQYNRHFLNNFFD